MILVWGLVFLAAGLSNAKSLVWFAFALEKSVYVIIWTLWIIAHPNCFSSIGKTEGLANLFALLFHCIYGIGDALFLVVFVRHGVAQRFQHNYK